MPVTYIDRIAALSACPPALEWLRAESYPDLATTWAACPRGDWMLWLAGRLVGPPGHSSRAPLVLAAAACAELALVHVPANEERPRRAIEAARAWTRGEATLKEVRRAASAASSAAITLSTAPTAAAARVGYAACYVGGIVTSSDICYPDTVATFAAVSAEVAAEAAAATADAATSVLAADVAASAAATLAATTTALLNTTLSRCADIVRGYYPTPPTLE